MWRISGRESHPRGRASGVCVEAYRLETLLFRKELDVATSNFPDCDIIRSSFKEGVAFLPVVSSSALNLIMRVYSDISWSYPICWKSDRTDSSLGLSFTFADVGQ
jgi:hypothetical protein